MYAAKPSRQSMDHLKPVASSRTGLATRLKGSPGRETPEKRIGVILAPVRSDQTVAVCRATSATD